MKWIVTLLLLFAATGARSLIVSGSDSVDFGNIPPREPQRHSFTLINNDSVPVAITRVYTGCSCTAANYAEGNINPGDSVSISLTFNPAGYKPGYFAKTAKIFTDDSKSPLRLYMKGKIMPEDGLVAPQAPNGTSENKQVADGARLKLIEKELDLGEFYAVTPQTGVIRYQNIGNEPLILHRVSGDCGCTVVKYTHDPLPPDSIGTIRVRFDGKGRPEGKFRKMIRIRSNSKGGIEAAYVTGSIKRSLVK